MPVLDENNVHIRQVWKHNLVDEFKIIREVVDQYPYVGMDTEFPGTVHGHSREYKYKTVKSNVDVLKLIQLGLTFADDQGNLPTCGTDKYCVWQFNFQFNPDVDLHAKVSIDFLRRSGFDFRKHNEDGVSASDFGELLVSSGAVLNEDMHWIAFHGAYDFGYLVKLLSGKKQLPDTESRFQELLKVFFPVIYDVKYLVKFHRHLNSGLESLASMIGVKRIGISHHAGSDSLLTYSVFKRLVEVVYRETPKQHEGVVFGFGS